MEIIKFIFSLGSVAIIQIFMGNFEPLKAFSILFLILTSPITIFLGFISLILANQINKIKNEGDKIFYKIAKECRITKNLAQYGFGMVRKIPSSLSSKFSSDILPSGGEIFRNGGKYDRVGETDYTLKFKAPRYVLKQEVVILENTSHFGKKYHLVIDKVIKISYLIGFVSFLCMFYVTSFSLVLFLNTLFLFIGGIFLIRKGNISLVMQTLSFQSLESLGFEKSFDAFSKDPIEARMIITPAFMDRLEQFNEKWHLNGKIRIIWEKDTFTLLLKGDIEKYGKEIDGSYALLKSMEEMLNLGYYSLNTNNK